MFELEMFSNIPPYNGDILHSLLRRLLGTRIYYHTLRFGVEETLWIITVDGLGKPIREAQVAIVSVAAGAAPHNTPMTFQHTGILRDTNHFLFTRELKMLICTIEAKDSIARWA
jgi:hypothetical protein